MKKITITISLIFMVLSMNAQWSVDPAQNTLVGGIPTDDVIPKVAPTGIGSTYISWFSYENGNYNLRMQLYDAFGYEQWAPGGILVSGHPSMSWLTDYNLSVDRENCAIVGFQDVRDGNNNIHVYKIDLSGQFLWGANGLALSANTAFEPYPVIATPDDNQTVFAWASEDSLGQGVIRLQKVMPDSTRLWGQWGIEYKSTTATENYIYPYLVPSDNNSVILVFHKQTGSFNNPKYLYAQKFDAAGNPVWPTEVAIYNGPGIPIIPRVCVEPDSAGGAVVCWHDTRGGMGIFNVFVQRVDQAGNLLFAAGGQQVAPVGTYIYMNPSMDYVPSTQSVYVFFGATDANQNQWGLFGQKMDATGQLVWGNNMQVLLPVGSDLIDRIECRRGGNQVLVTYHHYTFGNFQDAAVKACLVDNLGQPVWATPHVTLCTVQSEKIHGVTSAYHLNGQWVLAWEDGRNGNPDVYAQNITFYGFLGPVPFGLPDLHASNQAWLSLEGNPLQDYSLLKVRAEKGENLIISVFDILGHQVNCLYDARVSTTAFELRWNGTAASGKRLTPGLYFIEAKTGKHREAIKVIVR